MKLLLVSMFMALVSQSAFAQNDFVKGADVGFLTGQEKHGVKFHDRDGKERECLELLKTDYQMKEITFSTEEIPFESQCYIPITLENGVVCVNLDVEGQSVKLALDTGAWISYIDKKFTEGKPVSETKEDFSPLIGQFSTPIYSMQVSAANQTFPVNFGNLPSQMATMLKLMGIYGVIGFDLFNAFTVVIDFENQQLLLSK
jgi:hypothetical protein